MNKLTADRLFVGICPRGSRMDPFKAYDIRGKVPDELDEAMAYAIGLAYQAEIGARSVCVGHDNRLSSSALSDALAQGLLEGGADVYELGQCGTEEIYFATFHRGLDGGIMVTASHNPADYNGMKLVQREARPISGDTGLFAIRDRVLSKRLPKKTSYGNRRTLDSRPDYISHLLGYITLEELAPLRVVTNAGNGCAGPVLDALAEHLPFSFVRIQHEPDGSFLNGIPNPLLQEKRAVTAAAVCKHKADVGIAWDGDFDRCFFFDENGRFIEGYYIVGLLAESMLYRHPDARIIHDPRLIWNTIDIVTRHSGVPIESKTGHAFIKERMRTEKAVYGGEMSGHHYFRDFSYCDSGMITWLLVLELMGNTGKPLSVLVDEMIQAFPVSGEINRRIENPELAIQAVFNVYEAQSKHVSWVDGLSMDCGRWRFNLRSSNTEPLVRLNVEARGDSGLMSARTEEILALLDTF